MSFVFMGGVVIVLVIRLRTVLLYFSIILFIFSLGKIYIRKQESVSVVTSNESEGINLPILMYHGITEEEENISTYVISTEMFEEDLKYLQKNGYRSVTMDDIIGYVKHGYPLPENPIVITFDDGYYNNYCYAYPLLQKYGAKAVIFPIGKYTDLYQNLDDKNPGYAHITWVEIEEMMESGLIEIQNHSYDLHHQEEGRFGATIKKGERIEEYRNALEKDLKIWQSKMESKTGYLPTTFAYPFGGISEESKNVLKKIGFQATVSCEEKVNRIEKGNAESLFGLGRFLRSDIHDVKFILEK